MVKQLLTNRNAGSTFKRLLGSSSSLENSHIYLHRLVNQGRGQRSLRAMKFTGKHKSTGAVLAIMMRSGAIADFELHEFKSELFVRIWPPRNCRDLHLRKQIAALLPDEV